VGEAVERGHGEIEVAVLDQLRHLPVCRTQRQTHSRCGYIHQNQL
jgi:hypothetical protein